MNHSHILKVRLLDRYEELDLLVTTDFCGDRTQLPNYLNSVKVILSLIDHDPGVPSCCDLAFGKLKLKILDYMSMEEEIRKKMIPTMVYPVATPKPTGAAVDELSKVKNELSLMQKKCVELEDELANKPPAPVAPPRTNTYQIDILDIVSDRHPATLEHRLKGLYITNLQLEGLNKALEKELLNYSELKNDSLYLLSGHNTVRDLKIAMPNFNLAILDQRNEFLNTVGKIKVRLEKQKSLALNKQKKEIELSLKAAFLDETKSQVIKIEKLETENAFFANQLEKLKLENKELTQLLSNSKEQDTKHFSQEVYKESLRRLQEKKEKKRGKNERRHLRLATKKEILDITLNEKKKSQFKEEKIPSTQKNNDTKLIKDNKVNMETLNSLEKDEFIKVLLFCFNNVMDNSATKLSSLKQNQIKAKLNKLINNARNNYKRLIPEFIQIATQIPQLIYKVEN
jgi:hypothetical protein